MFFTGINPSLTEFIAALTLLPLLFKLCANSFDESNTRIMQISEDIKDLLYDFKLAIVSLAAISLTIRILLHFFVPGM